jgi:hypothetical protein
MAFGLVASMPAAALGDCRPGQTLFCRNPPPPPTNDSPTRVAAPEIDLGAGALGIGVLVAGVLLIAEGIRRRR